jgi:hypothetical protein
VWLGDWLSGEGTTLHAAADDLVDRAVAVACAMQASGYRSERSVLPELEARAPERRVLRQLWELGARVTRHEHRRELVLGTSHP